MADVRATGVAVARPSRFSFFMLTAPWFVPPGVKSLWSLVTKLDDVQPQDQALRAGVGDVVEVKAAGSAAELSLTLCEPGDARPARGRISVYSPLGLALLGAAEGEQVIAKTLFIEEPMQVVRIRRA